MNKKFACTILLVALCISTAKLVHSQSPLGVDPVTHYWMTIKNIFQEFGTNQWPIVNLPLKSGVVTVPALGTSLPVTFATPFSSSVGTNYSVVTTFGGTVAATTICSVDTITTNGFTLHLTVGLSGSQTMTYVAVPFN